jgi:DNA polymerase-3 subunit delta'
LGRLPTAYLFYGPPGSGKREAGTEIARTLLGKIENHPDFMTLVPEKGAIRIEAIRDLIQRISLKPIAGNRLVVLIEEAEEMTESAANALLKTLEEPPAYLLFILLSAAPERLPTTIRSRCQKIPFQIGEEKIRDRMKENLTAWREEIVPLLDEKPLPFAKVSEMAEALASQSEKLPSLLELLRGWWHDIAAYRETRAEAFLLLPELADRTRRQADAREAERIFREIDLIEETERAIEGNVNKTLALERLFVKLIY